jgi:excinuclease ABC subunit A
MAAELAIPSTEHTLYVLDEPTSGLHASDIRMLTNHLRKLVGLGHSVLVIEHNEEVIRHCDWIINLGPDAAAGGGEITFIGPPWQRPRC